MGGPLQGPRADDWVERGIAAGDILSLLTMDLSTLIHLLFRYFSSVGELMLVS